MQKLLKLVKNMKIQLICLLLILFVTALIQQTSATYTVLLLQLGVAVSTAILAELAFFGAVKSNSIQSAIISGMIIALLLMPGTELKLVWLAVTVAIAVKLLCRFPRGAHIFNPATTGLLMIMLFWGNRINWWGFSNPYLVIILGGIIIYRLKRLSLVFSYLIFRVIGLWLLNGLTIDVDMLLLPNLFLAFIMLTEPKTSPAKRFLQWQFGAGVGLLASLLFTLLPAFDGDLIALLIMNLLRPLLRLKLPVALTTSKGE